MATEYYDSNDDRNSWPEAVTSAITNTRFVFILLEGIYIFFLNTTGHFKRP